MMEIWHLCVFHVYIWGALQSLNRSTKIWCFHLLLFLHLSSGSLSGCVSQVLHVRYYVFTKSVSIALCHILLLAITNFSPKHKNFLAILWEIVSTQVFKKMFMPNLKTRIKTCGWKCTYSIVINPITASWLKFSKKNACIYVHVFTFMCTRHTLPASVVVDVEAANFTFDFCVNILDIYWGTQVFKFTDDTDFW